MASKPPLFSIVSLATAGCVALALGACANLANVSDARGRAFQIDASGELIRPTGYRAWRYIGTPVTPNDMNGGKAAFPEFHNVYMDPESFEHYARTGEVRDGTIVVKELVSVGSKSAVSGKGYFQGEFLGLEASVKSSRDFPGEPGNWAYFSFTQPETGVLKATAEAFPTASCNACHEASGGQDFLFTQYYPVLRAARGAGPSPENGARRTAVTSKAEDQWAATAPTPSSVAGAPPLSGEDLFGWLRSGGYRDYPAVESAPHPGRGPHTSRGLPVRVYMNEVLDGSLAAGRGAHPAGATAVKEMFDESGALQGWAVMVKTQADSADGSGWFWYEVTSASDAGAIAAIGNGVQGCVDCHQSGTDLVVSRHPLR